MSSHFRCLLLLLIALFANACSHSKPFMGNSILSPDAALDALVMKARKGDSRAAFDLYYLYNERKEYDTAGYWLGAAARTGDFGAMEELAGALMSGATYPCFKEWGATKKQAGMTLYRLASPTSVSACHSLGYIYKFGVVGSPDVTNAVHYFREASAKGGYYAWDTLAELIAENSALGSPGEAYYWCSMYARFQLPDIWAGRQMWDLRRRLTRELSRDVILRIISQVDQDTAAYRSGNMKFYYYGRPINLWKDDTIVPEVYREADRAEAVYRRSLFGRPAGDVELPRILTIDKPQREMIPEMQLR